MSSINHFSELTAWKEARVLVQLSSQLFSDPLRVQNDYSLMDQFKRATLSAMNNIAEGFGRATNKDFAHFLNIATASLDEVESMTYVLEDLSTIPTSEIESLRKQVIVVKKLCKGLRKFLLQNSRPT